MNRSGPRGSGCFQRRMAEDPDRAALYRSIDGFEILVGKMVTAKTANVREAAPALSSLRREYVGQSTMLTAAIEACLARTSDAAEWRTRLARTGAVLRRALANHQASWPTVAMLDDRIAFERSATGLIEPYRDHLATLRTFAAALEKCARFQARPGMTLGRTSPSELMRSSPA